MKILEIIQNQDGTFSSRRAIGILLNLLGITGKIIIFVIGLSREIININDLDNICNDGIYAGCLLLGFTTADLFRKK